MLFRNPIAITIDDNYVQHACVMLRSLDDHVSQTVDVYCIYDELTTANKKQIRREFRKSHLHLRFIHFDKRNLPDLPIKPGDHVSAAAFIRIWLPRLFKNLKQVLFMDTDIVINGDITTLLNMAVGNFPLAAVPDTGMTGEKKAGLGIAPDGLYFNSGIMLLNLDYFRQHHLTEQIAEFITQKPELCEFWDQDALNAVIKSNFLQLDYAYNVQTEFYNSTNPNVIQATRHPLIVHYTGGGACKPWFYHNTHPQRDLYYKYLRTTVYRFYHPPDLPRSWRIFRKLRFKLFYR